jgi:hypothetical protein
MAKRNSKRTNQRRIAVAPTTDPTAADSYNAHLRAISTLLLNMLNHVDTLRETAGGSKITWADAGDMTRAREFTVEAAWAVGAISSAEAKAKHGVSI